MHACFVEHPRKYSHLRLVHNKIFFFLQKFKKSLEKRDGHGLTSIKFQLNPVKSIFVNHKIKALIKASPNLEVLDAALLT
jgi:hypothetical protein